MERNSPKLTQNPRKLSAESYEKGRHRIVEQFSDRAGVRAVYDYGTVKHPGISDLDIMLVFDGATDPDWVSELSTDFDPLVDDLVGRGNIILIDDVTFEMLHYIDPNLEPTHLAGERLDRQRPGNKEEFYRDHASVMDWLPERVYQIERLHRSSEIPVMRALQLLKSLGYSLKVVDELVGYPDGTRFANEVASLRKTWFRNSSNEKRRSLLNAISTGREVGREALETWFKTRPKELFEDTRVANEEGIVSYFDGLAYVAGETGITTLDEWVLVGIRRPWFDHYRAYAHADNDLGDLIELSLVEESMSPSVLSTGYESYLQRKLEICSRNFTWIRRLGLTSGAFRFGFLLTRADWDVDDFKALREKLRSFDSLS